MGLGKLKTAATAKTTASKSTTPVCIGSAGLEDVIRELKAAKAAEKKAKADIVNAEARMVDEALDLRRASCRADRTVHAAVRIQAGSETILATQQGRFKKIGEEAVDPIRSIVGEDKYDGWFVEKTSFTFDQAALEALPNADKIADAMQAALGEHISILQVKTEIVPTEKFVRDTVLEDKAELIANRLRQNGLAEPFKVSFK